MDRSRTRPGINRQEIRNQARFRALVFDLGNVLVSIDWGRAAERIAGRTPFSVQELVPLFVQNGKLAAYERGEIDDQSFFASVIDLLHFHGSREEFIHFFSDIFAPIAANIALVTELCSVLPLAILSNTNPAHVAFLERNFDFLELFSKKFYSCSVGVRKPDARIYQSVVAGLGADAREILFIDDRQEYIEGALEAGWQAIHYERGMDLKGELLGLGLSP